MRRIVLVSHDTIQRFEEMRDCMDRVVENAVHGEFTSDDLKEMIANGSAFGAFCAVDGRVVMAIVWEIRDYPRMRVVNLVAMGGSRLFDLFKRYWDVMRSVWKSQGASHIECFTSPAMVRLIKQGNIPLKQIYVFSRGEL